MVKVIVGMMGSSAASGSSKLGTPDQLRPFLTMCKDHGVKELDTARVYNGGKSEELLGNVPEARRDFAMQTKAPGFSPGSLAYDKVIDNCNASLKALKQEKVDLYYFHGPDSKTPIEESCRAINQLYQEGKFSRFGVSNFSAALVEETVAVCKRNGWVLPSVYQGGYNPLIRAQEDYLFPTLRKHGLRFNAYSPLAGGYFSRPTSQLREPPQGGRMDQMKQFSSIYVNETSLELHDMLTEACEKEALTLKEATLRWLMHHSVLGEEDGVILGGSSTEQMEENLKACSAGPLPTSVAEAYEEMWSRYKAAGKGGYL